MQVGLKSLNGFFVEFEDLFKKSGNVQLRRVGVTLSIIPVSCPPSHRFGIIYDLKQLRFVKKWLTPIVHYTKVIRLNTDDCVNISHSEIRVMR